VLHLHICDHDLEEIREAAQALAFDGYDVIDMVRILCDYLYGDGQTLVVFDNQL